MPALHSPSTDSRDPDGDSEMASSADSVHTDSDAPGARTPTHFAHASAATASELSPPGSQPQQLPNISTAVMKDNGAGAQKSRASLEHPIAAWQTKRAQDDYQKAMEHVVDKDFNLHEFGDPFDERDLEEKLL
ncbi:hypothetical protein N7448_001346 [Penicillium atrosanguineum]|uniref:Uncharacterized protein n=1 Tax=Penicillium atrosanguineum TaxID=1132637 RepID=A0A9W9Q7A7_9EURO|nr:hypothetical protein N7448_001346 [Penicillium atrosanguineum]KAJ5324552.1 hypothetical protein N7476_003152 [Penicillium atrosanguineum]